MTLEGAPSNNEGAKISCQRFEEFSPFAALNTYHTCIYQYNIFPYMSLYIPICLYLFTYRIMGLNFQKEDVELRRGWEPKRLNRGGTGKNNNNKGEPRSCTPD